MSGLELGAGQGAFDLDLLMREQIAGSPWAGAPLTYTADYYTPAELEAAFERYVAEHGRFGCVPNSHMWHPTAAVTPFAAGQHSMDLLTADGGCEIADHDHALGDLPGVGVYQANCTSCRWHSIHTGENEAVEAWHDHALPGWRDLPVLPQQLTGRLGWDFDRGVKDKIAGWVAQHYPPAFLEPGSPIRTLRPAHADRHVPGRSPQGGYDLGVRHVTHAGG